MLRPLDIVVTDRGYIGILTDVTCNNEASIEYFGTSTSNETVAWWPERRLKLIDNLSSVLSRTMCHNLNHGAKNLALKHFPKTKE